MSSQEDDQTPRESATRDTSDASPSPSLAAAPPGGDATSGPRVSTHPVDDDAAEDDGLDQSSGSPGRRSGPPPKPRLSRRATSGSSPVRISTPPRPRPAPNLQELGDAVNQAPPTHNVGEGNEPTGDVSDETARHSVNPPPPPNPTSETGEPAASGLDGSPGSSAAKLLRPPPRPPMRSSPAEESASSQRVSVSAPTAPRPPLKSAAEDAPQSGATISRPVPPRPPLKSAPAEAIIEGAPAISPSLGPAPRPPLKSSPPEAPAVAEALPRFDSDLPPAEGQVAEELPRFPDSEEGGGSALAPPPKPARRSPSNAAIPVARDEDAASSEGLPRFEDSDDDDSVPTPPPPKPISEQDPAGTVKLPSSSLPRFRDDGELDSEPPPQVASTSSLPVPPRPSVDTSPPRSSVATSYPPPAPTPAPTQEPSDRIAVQAIRVINIVQEDDAVIGESDLHELADDEAEIEEFEELPEEDAALSSEDEPVGNEPPDVDVDVELPEELSDEAKRPPPPKRPTPPPPKQKKTSPKAPTRKRRAWFEQVFGEDFARATHQLGDRHIEREVDFIEHSLGVAQKGVVLDLACGSGRHTVELATRGYNVVGYDLSVYQLALAGEAAQERGAKINFLQGDMREMAFQEMFDGVFCWNTSFGYFEEEKNMEVAERVFKSLKPGGMFLIDVANRDYVMQHQPSQVWFKGDACVCMDDMSVDFITSRLRVKRSLILDDGRTRECFYSVRLYTLNELGKLLHEVGFRVIEASGHPATPGSYLGPNSQHLIVLAQRP